MLGLARTNIFLGGLHEKHEATFCLLPGRCASRHCERRGRVAIHANNLDEQGGVCAANSNGKGAAFATGGGFVLYGSLPTACPARLPAAVRLWLATGGLCQKDSLDTAYWLVKPPKTPFSAFSKKNQKKVVFLKVLRYNISIARRVEAPEQRIFLAGDDAEPGLFKTSRFYPSQGVFTRMFLRFLPFLPVRAWPGRTNS